MQNITNGQFCIQVIYIQGILQICSYCTDTNFAIFIIYRCQSFTFNSNKKTKTKKRLKSMRDENCKRAAAVARRPVSLHQSPAVPLHSRCYDAQHLKSGLFTAPLLRHLHGHCVVCYTVQCWLVFVVIIPAEDRKRWRSTTVLLFVPLSQICSVCSYWRALMWILSLWQTLRFRPDLPAPADT